jgi:hypothetical protein
VKVQFRLPDKPGSLTLNQNCKSRNGITARGFAGGGIKKKSVV